MIDGKAVAAAVRERVARRGRGARRRSSAGRRAWPRCWSATTPPPRSTCAASARPARRPASARSITSRTARSPGRAARAGRRAERDDEVDGILVQLPLPEQLDAGRGRSPRSTRPRTSTASPRPARACSRAGSPGWCPCTPQGVMELLAIGRGRPRGQGGGDRRPLEPRRPAALALLLGANATVTVCHCRTRDLGEVCRRADILVAAVGQPRLVRGDWSGRARRSSTSASTAPTTGWSGDVDFEAAREVAGAITPVPGGVGPMTIAMLLANTVQAARAPRGCDRPAAAESPSEGPRRWSNHSPSEEERWNCTAVAGADDRRDRRRRPVHRHVLRLVRRRQRHRRSPPGRRIPAQGSELEHVGKRLAGASTASTSYLLITVVVAARRPRRC